MAITIAVCIEKGGTGKTTTAETVAAILGTRGKRVLLVDLDAQGNATFISGANPDKGITDIFTGEADIKEVIVSCKHYDLLPADEYLSNAETAPEFDPVIIRDMLEEVQGNYDYIFCDCAPGLGKLLKGALLASDYALIPIDPRPLAVKGLDKLYATLMAVQAASSRLKILGVVLTRYSDRTVLNRQIRALLAERAEAMSTVLFDTTIREAIAVAESQLMQTSLIDYAKSSKVCQDYAALTDEILERIGDK